MTQQSFETQNRARWDEIDRLTQRLEKKRRVTESGALPSLYRQLCADIALAQHRMYGARLCAELNERLIRCRQMLARPDERAGRGFAKLMLQDFPRSVRRNARLFWLGMLLFMGPMILMVIASYLEPRWIFSVLGPRETASMDLMYGKGSSLELLRKEFGSDFSMFGFYVMNNIGIGLRTAATGLFAMVGSMFALGFQGVYIGAQEGYVHYACDTERFYTFVAGHSAFELVGIVICGVAGMRLGQAILKPGSLSRGAALATAGKKALPLLYGGALLIFFAAFIEGFWSAGPAPRDVKYLVGICNAVLLAAYFLLCGRKGEAEDEAGSGHRRAASPQRLGSPWVLGVAITRRHWPRLMAGWLSVALILWAAIVVLCRNDPGWACFFIWFTKPILTRQPIFFLSRALFGQPPGYRDFRKEKSLWTGILADLTLRRFSFQRAFRLPVIMLEGQKGRGYHQRVNVLSAHGGGSASSLAFVGLLLQLVITVGLLEYVGSFMRDGVDEESLIAELMDGHAPLWLAWMAVGFFAVSVALIEPFYAGAGFALYINSRTHLEGWDIEVAFRRMSLRLAPSVSAALVFLLAGALFTGNARAAGDDDPKSVVQEILKGPDFELSKYKVPIQKPKPPDPKKPSKEDRDFSPSNHRDSSPASSSGEGDGRWAGFLIIGLLVFVVALLLWKNRSALRRRGGGKSGAVAAAGPRVVMGMDLAPESLPDDIPQIAWREFQAGHHAAALRLLYRGALAWFVDRASLPVHESDTEGDCLRHAHHLPDTARVSFFESLTAAWINCAYANEAPAAAPMRHLCEQWPFSLRQRRAGRSSGGAASLLALSFVALLLQGCARPAQEIQEGYEDKVSGYKGAAALNPWLAATRLLERMDITVTTKQSLGGMPGKNTVLFIPAETITSRGEAKQVLQWAGRGGHVIIACSDTSRFHNDWKDDDFSSEPDETSPLMKELNVDFADDVKNKTSRIAFHNGESGQLESSHPAGLDLHKRPVQVQGGPADAAALASFRYQSGRVTLLASASPFRNRFIERADNAAILCQLIGLEESTSVMFLFSGKTNLWGMLMLYAWMPLTAVVLLIVLWLWRHLPRFGPAMPADQSSIRHFGTQLDETGAFLSDRAGHDALLSSARRSVLQAAAQRGIHADGGNFTEALAARTGIPADAINDALHNHSDSGDLISAAATLQKLQQSLGVTL